MMPAVKARPAAPTELLVWEGQAPERRLCLRGDWRPGAELPTLPQPHPDAGERITLDASGVGRLEAAAAPRLWALLAPLQRAGVQVDIASLPDALRAPLELALPGPGAAPEPIPAESAVASPIDVLRRHGRDTLDTAAFIGNVALSLGRLLRGRAAMRGGDYLRQLDQCGPMSLPIVALTCFLVGLILAYMGGAQLQRLGAQHYIAEVVTVGMVRELAPFMTGVILAGRIGAAFAAQLGTMQANEEVDALRAMGIDPFDHLVLPRLLAMLTIAPLIIAYAALVGVLAGLPPVVGVYGVPAWEYLHKCLASLNWTHLWIGQVKGTLYIVLVALAGCREGLHAGRDAQAVGAATTTAVVKGLVWIVVAASATTVLFQSLGL